MEMLFIFTNIMTLSLLVPGAGTLPDDHPISESSAYYCIPGDEVTTDMFLPAPLAEVGAQTLTNTDSGILPEGDLLNRMVFSTNGSKIFVVNRMSRNVSVIDWASLSVDTTFSVRAAPDDIACTDDYAIIAYGSAGSADVYSLKDYSLAASFAIKGSTRIVKTDRDGKFAFIAARMTSTCTVIDLSSLTVINTIPDFPGLLGNMYGSYANRRSTTLYMEFQISPDGNYVIGTNNAGNQICFFNRLTGKIDYTIPGNSDGMAFSGDGKYLIARKSGDALSLLKINLSTFAVESSIDATGFSLSRLTTKSLAVNHDGNKVFTTTNQSVSLLLDFSEGNWTKFSNSQIGKIVWIKSNFDHSLALCGGSDGFATVDFGTEEVIGRITEGNTLLGYISPVTNNCAGINTSFTEQVTCYSFSDSSATLNGAVLSGSSIEGDGPRRVCITPDGSVAVITNELSDNVCIMNMKTLAIDAVLDVGDKPYNVAVTSDSKVAVVCLGSSDHLAKIIDLETGTIVASVQTGAWSSTISITPDNSYAYITNISSSTVSVIHLDGASSSKVTDIPCKGMAGTWFIASGIFNNAEVSPDGSTCLVVAGADDVVRVIDTATNKVVANLKVGNFPLRVCFNHDGTRAIVSNFADDSFSLLNIDGASSSVITTKACGDRPARVAFNPVAQQFAVAIREDKKIILVDQSSGNIMQTFSYPYFIDDLAYTETGDRLAMVISYSNSARMYHNDDYVVLNNSNPIVFDYCPATNSSVATGPNGDIITHIAYEASGISQQNIATDSSIPQLAVSPNPGSDCFAFNVSLPTASHLNLAVFDLNGRMISNIEEDTFTEGNHSFSWDTELPTGVYAIKLEACEKSVTRLFTVCR